MQQLALFSREGQQTVSGLLPLAADGGAALAKVERHTGGTLQLELRRPLSTLVYWSRRSANLPAETRDRVRTRN
ncbi:hypothetical protein [Deinococcus radiophilus]|uniref:hypothetical protein n=1 Tax=Deinococcus radiophilus TaxID=32062 RepID=UPI003611FC7E